MNEQFISLNFRIQNETVTIEKVNVNQPLLVAVKKALKDHLESRKLEDWIVTFNGSQIDPKQKVKDLGITNNDTVKLTPKEGGGGEY